VNCLALLPIPAYLLRVVLHTVVCIGGGLPVAERRRERGKRGDLVRCSYDSTFQRRKLYGLTLALMTWELAAGSTRAHGLVHLCIYGMSAVSRPLRYCQT
jgi:hypothetical protein